MTRVTSKGQVTIPKPMRDAAGIKPGSEVDFEYDEGRLVVVKRGAEGARAGQRQREFSQYLSRVRGTLDLGMTTDDFMELLRGD